VTQMPLSSHVGKFVVRGRCNCSKASDKEPLRKKKEGGGKQVTENFCGVGERRGRAEVCIKNFFLFFS